jgi:hypothetical protein
MAVRIGSVHYVNGSLLGWLALVAAIAGCELLHHRVDRAAHNLILPLLLLTAITVLLLFWDGCKQLSSPKRYLLFFVQLCIAGLLMARFLDRLVRL